MPDGNTLNVAFKEWAAVCRALASGHQSLILRKGGIAEAGGDFRPEHPRFLLYPTHFHAQQQAGLKPQHLPLLDEAEADRPPPGRIRFTHFAEVKGVRFVNDLGPALALDPLHVWSEATVRQRFAYRTPGLFVFTVRVFRLAVPVEVVESPEYAGCKTWVELTEGVPIDGATPVLSDDEFKMQAEAVRSTLGE